jgi:hypothetical protein
MAVELITYRLRGGQIQPILSSCAGAGVPEGFYIQTFGVDKVVTDISDAKTTLLASTDMQGQKPGNVEDPTYIQTTYASASYQGRPLRTTDGDLVFSANEAHVTEFAEEEVVGL